MYDEVPPLTLQPRDGFYVVHDANGRICAVGQYEMCKRRVEGWHGLVTAPETEDAPMTAQTPPAPVLAETRIQQYVMLRDKLKELDEKQRAERAPYTLAMEKLSGWITEFLTTAGVESVKTKFGTAYVSNRSTASLEDPDAFMRHVIGTEAWELLDRRANATACGDFAKQHNGELPPGVKFTTIATVGVRRKSGT